MRATAPSCFPYRLTALLLLAAAPVFCAGPADAIADLASALSQNNAPDASRVFDSAMQGFSSLESNIEALTAQTDILCAIDILNEKETAGGRELDVDWYLQLKSQLPDGPTERRRERITLALKMIRGKWKITSISNPKILAPLTMK